MPICYMIWSGPVLIRTNMVQYYMENCNKWDGIQIRFVHSKHTLYLTLTETQKSSEWLTWSSLGTLKLAFNVSCDDQGSHTDDLSFQREWAIYGMSAGYILSKISCVILGPLCKNEMYISCEMMYAGQTHTTLLYPTYHLLMSNWAHKQISPLISWSFHNIFLFGIQHHDHTV